MESNMTTAPVTGETSSGGQTTSSSDSTRGRGNRGRGGSRGERSRGGGGDRRGRGRGGAKGGMSDQSRPQRPPQDAQAQETVGTVPADAGAQPTAQNGVQEDDSDAEVCFICAGPVVHNSVSPCNHRTCHICALRMRALYKNRACLHCRVSSVRCMEKCRSNDRADECRYCSIHRQRREAVRRVRRCRLRTSR